MIHDRTIICVASNWAVDRTGKHHVMSILARENNILWVNYHGTRRPRPNRADARSAARTLFHALRGARPITPTMGQLTPLVIPGTTNPTLTSFNRWAVTAQIRRALKRFHPTSTRPVQIWSFAPDVAYLAGRFDEECLVYYCVDDHAAFDGFDADAIRRAERRLLQRAHVVFATAQPLYDSKSAVHDNVHLVRHGVDVDHFRRALEPGIRRPGDVEHLQGPILGFFGLIHHWVDVKLIARVARLLPAMQVVLIGQALVDVRELSDIPNVHLLGRKPYRDLPAYCAAFDAALVPFKCNELTRNVNPIKLREYLAAGLPVVSTPLPEAERHQPDVETAPDAASFARACERAVRSSSPSDRIRRSRRVAHETWEAVVEHISPLVMAACETRSRSAEHPSPFAAHIRRLRLSR